MGVCRSTRQQMPLSCSQSSRKAPGRLRFLAALASARRRSTSSSFSSSARAMRALRRSSASISRALATMLRSSKRSSRYLGTARPVACERAVLLNGNLRPCLAFPVLATMDTGEHASIHTWTGGADVLCPQHMGGIYGGQSATCCLLCSRWAVLVATGMPFASFLCPAACPKQKMLLCHSACLPVLPPPPSAAAASLVGVVARHPAQLCAPVKPSWPIIYEVVIILVHVLIILVARVLGARRWWRPALAQRLLPRLLPLLALEEGPLLQGAMS